ncbi:MAG: hypothetical protein ACFB14_08610 [Leptolyngbyaceae cyanobacterium]|mgnify:CR=1 FL=1
MKIIDLEYKTTIFEKTIFKDSWANTRKINGGRRAHTNAHASASDGHASVHAHAKAVGDRTRTYTSSRTSVRKGRYGSLSYALGVSYASSRSAGNQSGDVSSSVAYDTHRG